MAMISLRPFKDDLHALIDSVDPSKEGWADRLHASILESAHKHKTERALDVPKFTRQIVLLVQANNAARAKKLVDVLDDTSITYRTALLIKIAIVLVKWSLIAAFVIFVIWAYNHCSGA